MKFIGILFILSLAVVASSQTSPPKEPPKSSIEGLVVKEPGNQPLKKVNVEIRLLDQDGNTPPYKAVTDIEGHFEVEGLSAGRYNIHIERPGFRELKQPSRMFAGHTVTLNAGETLQDLTYHMQPAAVILGKVLDLDGDPLMNVSILITRFGASHAGWQAYAGNNMTNDLGEYRIGNLPPGKYLIEAIPVNFSAGEGEVRNRDGTKRPIPYPTYYPGTADKNQAVPLELHPGDEIPINLTMSAGPSFHVRGVMTGLPHGSGEMQVMLRAKNDLPWLNQISAAVKQDGSFEVTNVLPGQYEITFFSFSGTEPEVVQAAQTIEVKDSDLDSLKLNPETSAHVSGLLHTDNNSKIDWTRFSIRLKSNEEGDFGEMYFAGGPRTDSTVKNDGSFEMKKVPPGKYHLVASSRGAEMQNYYVKSVTTGGNDVTDSGFTVGGGSQSLDVLLSSSSVTIEGAVIDGKDQPAKDVVVVAVPNKELRAWRETFKQANTDQRGHFALNGLRPGEYTILSVEGMEDEDFRDSAYLKRYEDLAEKVKVDRGEHKNVAVKLIPETSPQ